MTDASCGSCSLCCKLLKINALDKPMGKWCEHCRPGAGGCSIYETRPDECATFECVWLTAAKKGGPYRFPDFMKPNKSRCVIIPATNGLDLVVHPDCDQRTAWRKQLVFDWLVELVKRGLCVIVKQSETDFFQIGADGIARRCEVAGERPDGGIDVRVRYDPTKRPDLTRTPQ